MLGTVLGAITEPNSELAGKECSRLFFVTSDGKVTDAVATKSIRPKGCDLPAALPGDHQQFYDVPEVVGEGVGMVIAGSEDAAQLVVGKDAGAGLPKLELEAVQRRGSDVATGGTCTHHFRNVRQTPSACACSLGVSDRLSVIAVIFS